MSAKKHKHKPTFTKKRKRKKLRRENIIRIIPKRFQCGRRVFHSMFECNHSLASSCYCPFFFHSVCIARCSLSVSSLYLILCILFILSFSFDVCVCAAAFDFLLDTRATIQTVNSTLNTTLCTCALFGVYFVFVKKFFRLSLYFCLCLCLSFFSLVLITIFSICSYTFRSFPFYPQTTITTSTACVSAASFHFIPHHSTSLGPFHLCMLTSNAKCARLRRYYKIAYIMSSFVTRHTRTQLTTENVVFDKVLLLLVLFGSEMCGE